MHLRMLLDYVAMSIPHRVTPLDEVIFFARSKWICKIQKSVCIQVLASHSRPRASSRTFPFNDLVAISKYDGDLLTRKTRWTSLAPCTNCFNYGPRIQWSAICQTRIMQTYGHQTTSVTRLCRNPRKLPPVILPAESE